MPVTATSARFQAIKNPPGGGLGGEVTYSMAMSDAGFVIVMAAIAVGTA